MKEISELINTWSTYLINGEHVPREKLLEMCKECGGETYHRLSCKQEKACCKNHLYVVECDCLIRPGEEV
jgi:hypothetical protein